MCSYCLTLAESASPALCIQIIQARMPGKHLASNPKAWLRYTCVGVLLRVPLLPIVFGGVCQEKRDAQICPAASPRNFPPLPPPPPAWDAGSRPPTCRWGDLHPEPRWLRTHRTSVRRAKAVLGKPGAFLTRHQTYPLENG